MVGRCRVFVRDIRTYGNQGIALGRLGCRCLLVRTLRPARLLPDSISAKPGYRVTGYSIRRDAVEAAQADALKGLAEGVVQSSQFEIVTSNQATRWYLSAFVCP
jgi:hypothetical protein